MAVPRRVAQSFQKYTVQPTGIWATFSKWFQLDSNRSSGIPLNPLYRNPPPAANDPKLYKDPVTMPAADLAENPYWKRDTRRGYPKLSVVNQSDVVGLLTVGSKASPKDDVLQIGDAGSKQLVALKEEGSQSGLPALFQKDTQGMSSVLGPGGLPPMPANLSQGAQQGSTGKRYELLKDQPYGFNQYPCRTFG